MPKKFTYEEVKLFVENCNSNCTLISKEYVGTYEKLEIKCKCGQNFITTFGSFKSGGKRQCNECGNKLKGHPEKFTHEEFIAMVSKNDNIKITGIYSGMRNHIEVTCNRCHESWNQNAESLKNKKVKCANCDKTNKKKTTNQFKKEMFELAGDEYTLLGEYQGNKKPLEIKHNVCNGVYETPPSNFLSGGRCPYCSGHKVLKGYNDMWTTNPELAKLLLNPDDGHTYSKNSNVKVDWKCPCCEEIIKSRQISQINSNRLSCPKCSDGVSYPEKFMHNFLQHLNIEFERQKTFEWSKGIFHENDKLSGDKRYDFYIPSLNIIIETHGEQHSIRPMGYSDCRTLSEEIENDKIKEMIANRYGINKYIAIDCKDSDLNYIKNNILNSELSEIYNLKDVDWRALHIKSIKPLVKIVAELWEIGYVDVPSISSMMNMSKDTVKRYIKQARSVGWCN